MNRGLVLSGILAVTMVLAAHGAVRSATAKHSFESVVYFFQAAIFAWLAIIAAKILEGLP
jgi:hypothetical protein